MFYLSAYGLAFLELTFVTASLMFLHSMKRVVGNISFYISFGCIVVFAQFVTASGINISNAYPGLNVDIGPTIFFTPLMAALLIAYIVDGTLEAQRMILGIMGMVAIFSYFSYLSELQCDFPGYALSTQLPKSFLVPVFQSARKLMLASLLSILVVFLALPIVYQILRNRSIGLGISVIGALIFTEVLDAFFYELVTNYQAEDWWEALRQSYLTRAIAMLWVSGLTVLYLVMRKIPDESESQARNPFDIINAFMGRYGQERRLQANVREWEGRYRMVVENTNDLILLVAETGVILDANRIAIQTLGYSIAEIAGVNIQTIMKDDKGEICSWNEIWCAVFGDAPKDQPPSSSPIVSQEYQMSSQSGKVHILDTTITPIMIQESLATLLVSRDVTRRKQLEGEREALQTQLIHSQRMEAVGKLAGGIAHDFNNLLHAIQGSLDMLESVASENQKARELSSNITKAVKRASTLTGQLLGFARGGKYKVVRIDVEELIRQTEGLFRPLLGKKVELKVVIHPDSMIVEGDFTQLEQVLLNILLNAMAAIESEDGKIILRAEPATEHTPGWSEEARRSEEGDQWIKRIRGMVENEVTDENQTVKMNEARAQHTTENYIVFRIRDNGKGMEESTRKRIFEPFYTTKQNKGTGMGLAMAYGCVDNHNGWIHVTSEFGNGSEFFIFLPRSK